MSSSSPPLLSPDTRCESVIEGFLKSKIDGALGGVKACSHLGVRAPAEKREKEA
jgi:hypothetical protein